MVGTKHIILRKNGSIVGTRAQKIRPGLRNDHRHELLSMGDPQAHGTHSHLGPCGFQSGPIEIEATWLSSPHFDKSYTSTSTVLRRMHILPKRRKLTNDLWALLS